MFVSFALIIVIMPKTRLAMGIYLVLFGWIIVAAFKMGMIFQNAPAQQWPTEHGGPEAGGGGIDDQRHSPVRQDPGHPRIKKLEHPAVARCC